ncbi:MAG TPA: hypothetical protein VGR35_20780 [Tepidisphaeraceae bacterium]|nr:hypothetical protein [Tepidisphaeraceae bacterium]
MQRLLVLAVLEEHCEEVNVTFVNQSDLKPLIRKVGQSGASAVTRGLGGAPLDLVEEH